MATSIHVVPKDGSWAVEQEGEQLSTYPTQKEAVDFARDLAGDSEAELVVHGADGRIREKDSHGHDPRDIPG